MLLEKGSVLNEFDILPPLTNELPPNFPSTTLANKT